MNENVYVDKKERGLKSCDESLEVNTRKKNKRGN